MASSKEIRAGKAYMELTTKDKIDVGLNAVKAKLQAFGSGVSSMGRKLLLVGGIASGVAALAVKSFVEVGDSLDEMSSRTGASIEWLSQMKLALKQNGSSLEDLEVAIKQMNKGFAEGKKGGGELKKALNSMGLSIKDLEGMTIDKRFEFLADKIANIQDPALKAAAALQIFGKSGTKILPVADALKSARLEAEKLGLTVSKLDAKNAAELADKWDILTSVFEMFAFNVGAALAPTLKDIADVLIVVIGATSNWIKENKSFVLILVKIVGFVVAVGGALIALSVSINLAAAAVASIAKAYKTINAVLTETKAKLNIVKNFVLEFVTSQAGLIIIAITAIVVAILYFTGTLEKMISWIGEKFGQLTAYFEETMGGIKDAIIGGDITLAIRILFLSIKVAWMQGIQPLKELWIGLKSMLTDTWMEFVYGLLSTWLDLKTAWYLVASFFGDIWVNVVGGFVKAWNAAIGGIAKAWVRLKGLFDTSIDVDAEVNKIDAETSDKNKVADEEKQNKLDERNKEKADYLNKRQQQKDDFEKQKAEEQQANDSKYADEMKGVQDELDQAKKERQQALDEAKKKAEEARKNDGKDVNKNEIETTLKQAKGSTQGSFYASQIEGLKYVDPDTKRTADGVDKLVKETKNQTTLMKKQSTLAFT